MLLADDVGLGKTVQAGVDWLSSAARGAVERAGPDTGRFCASNGLRNSRARFRLEPAVVDTAEAKRRAGRLPRDVNLWSTVPRPSCRSTMPSAPRSSLSPAASRWDLVLIDEAHNITLGTERFDAVHTIARLAVLALLTATPHNGDRRAFAALCSTGALPGDRPLVVFAAGATTWVSEPRAHPPRCGQAPAGRTAHARSAAASSAP